MSLIAVNLLGMELENNESRRNSVNEIINEDTKLQEILNNPEYFSPYDDLAFMMYVDIDIAKIIKTMEIKKHLAVISKYAHNSLNILECSFKQEH